MLWDVFKLIALIRFNLCVCLRMIRVAQETLHQLIIVFLCKP